MRQLFLLFFLYFALFLPVRAQLLESFADGNFSQSPRWIGDSASFQVNAAGQLQSKGPAVSGTVLQLATANTLAVGGQWEFYVQLSFATSATNYAEVHLLTDSPELKSTTTRGYFVRMGGTEDEVSLYRKDGNTSTRIINSPDKTIATSNNRFKVRVTRSIDFAWTLELDVTGTGQNYVVQGTVQDNRYVTSSYFGVLCRYTQANAQRFYFDDFSIIDIAKPTIAQATPRGARTLDLIISEPVSENEAKNASNFLLNGTAVPATVEWSSAQPQLIRLQFNQDFETGTNTLLVKRLLDRQGNVAENLTTTFVFAPSATKGDVRITEIYSDINPLQDLPAAEFIEIYNVSNKALNLQGWQYSDATANTGTFPAYVLRPGAYMIVCAAADTALYRSFGPVVGLSSFPSLNDSGDEVELFDVQGQLIDKVRYTAAWYRDTSKDDGGWSLELINVNSTCTGASVWKASLDARGGTPGQANSVQMNDTSPPVLQSIRFTAPVKVVLRFDEPLDSAASATPIYYSVSPSIPVQQVRVLGPDFMEVELQLGSLVQENAQITVTVQQVRDCAGNVASASQMMTAVLPSTPAIGDVVINEILFNPKPNGVDFVELVNRSKKYLEVQNWKIANRNTDGQVAAARSITTEPLLLAPDQYLVLTTDVASVQRDYPAAKLETFLVLSALPSLNDEAGSVVLLLPNDSIMDEVRYTADQHFTLIRDPEGISLERMQLSGPSITANFHSAATQLGATPGYLNSQAQENTGSTKKLTIEPKVFTPDGDGVDDALLLQFHLPQQGFMGTITAFDSSGRLVRKLISNQLLGTETLVQWDGLTDSGSKAPIGMYILLIELFDLQGRKETLKETAVVGGRF